MMDDSNEGYAWENFVCSSLREHPVWSSTATHLLQSDRRRWREASLGTHDIALSIPDPHTELHEVFRLLLISTADVTNPQTLSRIQQLCDIYPSGNALVFLLRSQEEQGIQPAMQAFMELHVRLTTTTTPHHLPIIPLHTLADLPTALQAFQSSLAASREHSAWLPAVDAARDLLPYCAITTTTTTNINNTSTSGAAPGSGGGSSNSGGRSTVLSRRGAENLSRVFFSFRELLEGVGTEDGQRDMERVVGEAEAEGVVAFWGWEFEVASGGSATMG